VRVFPVTLRAIARFMVAAIVLVAPAVVPSRAHADTVCAGGKRSAQAKSHFGRRGTHAPRRPGPARRTRAIPWLKGNLPNVQAQGAFVLDLAGGQELYARRPDEPRPIASISKLAATLTVIDRGLDLDATTTISHSDTDVARGGARSRLLEGMTLSNRDLLHAALLGSDNRAIPALGRAVGLDATQLAAAMTQKVRELGLRNTRFVEPTGLSPENVSTPREIVDLLRAVMDHPVLGEIDRKVEYDAHPVGRAPIRYFATYRAAARPNTLVLGAKTGFNNVARYCLVVAARVSGRSVAMAFLGTEGEMTRFGDVARVSDWIAAQESKAPSRESMVAQVSPVVPFQLSASPATAPLSPLASSLSAAPAGQVVSPSFALPPLAFITPTAATPKLPKLPAAPAGTTTASPARPSPAMLTPPSPAETEDGDIPAVPAPPISGPAPGREHPAP
jgi:D-alanyl-D-alanine endopeptidase (penicillin-binding protein 7)